MQGFLSLFFVAIGFGFFPSAGVPREDVVLFVVYEGICVPLLLASLWYTLDAYRTRRVINSWGLEASPVLGATRRIAWRDLSELSYSGTWYLLRLRARDGTSVRLSVYLHGLGRLRALLHEHAGHLLKESSVPDRVVIRALAALEEMPALLTSPGREIPAVRTEVARQALTIRVQMQEGITSLLFIVSFLAAGFALLFASGPGSWQPLDYKPYWVGALPGLGAGLIVGWLLLRRGTGRALAAATVANPLALAMFGVCLALMLNALEDRSSVLEHRVPVLKVRQPYWSPVFPQVVVPSWRRGEVQLAINIRSPLAKIVTTADTLVIRTRAGRFGWEWVDSMNRVEPSDSLATSRGARESRPRRKRAVRRSVPGRHLGRFGRAHE